MRQPGRYAGGRPRLYAIREVVNALLYVVKTGCQWWQLPENFPSWQSVYQQAWRDDGTWERAGVVLRQRQRLDAGRNSLSSVAIIDAPTMKTALKGGTAQLRRGQEDQGPQAPHCRGYRGQPASLCGVFGRCPRPGRSRAVLMRLFCRIDSITPVYADGSYSGKLVSWAKEIFDYALKIVKRSEQKGFIVLPKR